MGLLPQSCTTPLPNMMGPLWVLRTSSLSLLAVHLLTHHLIFNVTYKTPLFCKQDVPKVARPSKRFGSVKTFCVILGVKHTRGTVWQSTNQMATKISPFYTT